MPVGPGHGAGPVEVGGLYAPVTPQGPALGTPYQDEWDFSTDEAFAAAGEDVIIIASIDSAPVPTFVTIVFDEYIDLLEGYDDPDVMDFEWSGPIQPNAPPLGVFDDPWNFDEETAPSVSDDGYQQADITPPAFDDAWDWDAEQATDDEIPVDEVPQTAAVVPPQSPEDPWDWTEESTDDVETDQALPPNSGQLCLEDPWDWDAEQGPQAGLSDDGYQQSDLVGPALVEDPWDWTEEATDDAVPDDPIGADAAPTPPEDPWDWQEEATDDVETDATQPPDSAQLCLEDPWEWTEDGTDDFETDQSLPPSSSQPSYDDAWDYDLEQVPEDELPVDESQSVFVVPASQVFDDPWDYQEPADGTFLADSYQQADTSQPAYDDAWDWDAEQAPEDEVPDDQPQSVVPPLLPGLTPEDPWYWHDDATQPSVSDDGYMQSDGTAPPLAQVFDDPFTPDEDVDDDIIDHFWNFDSDQPSFDDAWDWDAEQAVTDEPPPDDVIGANAILALTPPPDDAWDWTEEATDDLDADPVQLVNAILVAAAADDPWDWDSEQTVQPYTMDVGYFQSDAPPIIPNPFDSEVMERLEEEAEDFFADHFSNIDLDQPAYDDAWDWDSEQGVSDEWLDWPICDTEPQDAPLTPITVEDPYDFEGDVAFEDDLWHFDTSQVTGGNGTVSVFHGYRRLHHRYT